MSRAVTGQSSPPTIAYSTPLMFCIATASNAPELTIVVTAPVGAYLTKPTLRATKISPLLAIAIPRASRSASEDGKVVSRIPA